MDDIDQLKSELSESAVSFCKYLFPAGKVISGEYTVGSLRGEPGNSLKIRITGNKIGVWKDFATGECGNNFLDLLCQVRGVGFCPACEEAKTWLNRPRNRIKTIVKSAWHATSPSKNPNRDHVFHDLHDGTADDYNTLSSRLNIGVDALLLAAEDGILKFFHHYVNGRCWSVVDKNNLVRQDRRLDGQAFILQDGRSSKSRTIGSPKYPVGLPTDKPVIALVEGSSDLLAAYCLILSENLCKEVTPVAILGASNVIHDDALLNFKGKHVLGFPDYDKAGIAGMTRWQYQLQRVVSTFKVFDYCGLIRDDG